MKPTLRNLSSALILLLAAGCAETPEHRDPETVKLVSELPAYEQCEIISQAVGIGSGEVDENYGRADAEQNLREIAAQRDGNIVYVAEKKSRVIPLEPDALETILIGEVYSCL